MGDHEEIIAQLSERDWLVRRRAQPKVLPRVWAERFPWLPRPVISLVCGFDAIVSLDEKAWFVTEAILSGEIGSAFAWNQWELDSLDAASGDIRWQESIRRFWDLHFPLLFSVKSGYAYVAIRNDLKIVAGEEPEFEETEEIADDFATLLKLVAGKDGRLDRLI